MNKFSTGYWELFDPTNGFIAFKTDRFKAGKTRQDKIKIFFESDLLSNRHFLIFVLVKYQ